MEQAGAGGAVRRLHLEGQRAGHGRLHNGRGGPASLGILALPALLAACAPGVADSAEDRLPRRDSLDTDAGLYHLELAIAPDPPVVGSAALTVDVEILSGNPDLVGARLVGGEVWVDGSMPGEGAGFPAPVEAVEQGTSGSYLAGFEWVRDGYWELAIEIQAGSGDDGAVVGYLVGPAP